MAEYYKWRQPGRPVEVRFNLATAHYMAAWFHGRHSESVECFGMLLGRIRHKIGGYVVNVEDFEPFDPAKLHGRPKAPPDSGLQVVGIYRRHRCDDPRLDQLDASLIQSSFVHRGMVYLLISPSEGPDRAALFTQRNGEIHGYLADGEFPFDSDLLRRPKPSLEPRSSRPWIPATGFAVSVLALIGWFFWLRQDAQSPVAAASMPTPTEVARDAPQPQAKAVSHTAKPKSAASKLKSKTLRRKHR